MSIPLMVWVIDHAALPERVLMKFFADPLRLQRGLAAVERFEQLQGLADQQIAGEDAAQPDQAFVCVHRNQRVNAVSELSAVHPPGGVAPRRPALLISAIFIAVRRNS